MKRLILFFAFAASILGQGTTPSTGVWTLLDAGPAGATHTYTTPPVGAYDKAVWIPTRQCYSVWGEYKTQTFSEENDALGCYSYAEQRWHMLLQAASQHSVHRPQTGHQWGEQTYVSATDTLYWTSNSASQGLEEMWSQYRFDMAGLVSSDVPLFTLSSTLDRPWISGGSGLSGYEEYDQTNGLMVFFPDSAIATGHVTICSIGFSSTMACTATAATSGPPATQNYSNLRWDADDGYTYWYGGGASVIYRINAASPSAWQSFPNATCTGADCVFTSGSIGHAPVRYGAGFAYSTVDHKFILIGGNIGPNSGGQFLDVWTFDPAAGSGVGAWNEVSTSSGKTAGTNYPTYWPAPREGDRLAYDSNDNVFVIADDKGVVWAYPLSAATGNYARSSGSYAPCSSTVPNCAAGVTGPINRTLPPTTASTSYAQTGAFDLSVDAAGGSLYLSRVEPSIPGDTTPCQFTVPYIWSSSAGWLGPTGGGGTLDQGCAAINSSTLQQPSGHVYHATVAGVEWEANERRNFSGYSSNGQVQAQSYNSGTGTWSGGNVGCASATCFSINSSQPHNYSQGLVNANGVPTVLTIEITNTSVQTGNVFVSQYNGTSWTSLTGTTPLNVLGGSGTGNFATYAAMASDPSGNIMVCWAEEVNINKLTMTTTPQVECKYWNGSAFSVIGGGSLNISATSWSRSPSVVYASGTWYVGWAEQTQTGRPQIYVKSCPLSGACSLVGSGTLNHTPSTGIAYHPSLAADGTTLLVGWEEQAAQGSHALGHISKWTGSVWTAVATGFSADATNGSIMDVGIAVPTTGTVAAGWTEATWGNLTQVYTKSFSLSSGCTITTTSFPAATVGQSYSQTAAQSGCGASSWSVASGSLPSWASLNSSTGAITGTVSGSAGTATFTLAYSTATSGSLSITTNLAPSITTSSPLPNGTVGTSYSQTLAASGGTLPLTWSKSSGTVPTGTTFTSSGVLSGTPTTVTGSPFTFTAVATDANGIASAGVAFQVTINSSGALSVTMTVTEALIQGTGGFSGLARTNDPLTVGVPLPDSAGITSTSVLGLTGASAAQFSSEAVWPSGNIKWLKIRAIIPSVSAGGTAAITLTNSGSGNFGGSNLATDNGSTITVATGTATFTIKKANFNLVDQVVIGATTVVSSGASTGVVVLGPPHSGTYPANVTCLPTSGGSNCTTVFSSANDASSTCAIAENGPAMAYLKCYADLTDGSGNVYMHTTVYEYFYQNRSQMYVVAVKRNADYGTSNTFATASKGFQSFELRVTPNISGTLTYTIAKDSGTATGTTFPTYLYQAESNLAKAGAWCQGFCGPPSPLLGWALMQNGSSVATGTASQYPTGWADVSNSSGVGVMIGQDQFAAYGNKSLEFQASGADVRIGLWAYENNTVSPSTIATQGTNNTPYYAAWPQWDVQKSWLEFHATAPASPANDHLKLQYPLLAYPSASWYNAAAVFAFPLLDPIEEDNYYTTVFSNSNPSVPTSAAIDYVMGNTTNSNSSCVARGGGAIPTVCIWRWWNWKTGGGANQMEFRESGLKNFIRRGFTGQYMHSNYWYKWAVEDAFPMSDGSEATTYKWTAHASETIGFGFPTATSANYALSIAGVGGQARLNIETDQEHGHAQGMDTFYLMSGDELIKDHYLEAVVPFFANNTSPNNYTGTGTTAGGYLYVDRSIGNLFKWGAHLYTFLNSIGDSTDATTILGNMKAVFQARLQPDVCAYAGYPSGCTPDPTDAIPQLGTSKVRGVSNVWVGKGLTVSGCSGNPNGNDRIMKPFMTSEKIAGMLELYPILQATGYAYAQQFWDYMYGSAQWAFGEMLVDNGSSIWTGNGFHYGGAIDFANACNTADWADVTTEESNPFHWTGTENYLGPLSADRVRQFNNLASVNAYEGSIDEFYHDTMGTAIYYILHPQANTLQTIPINSFTDNGGGSYTIGWTTPASTTALRVKSGVGQIVDWIGFDAGTYAFIGNPATTQNWFASTEAPSIPAPVTGNQSMTITGLATGLTAPNFMVKAMAPSGGVSTFPSVMTGIIKGAFVQ